MLQLLLDTQLSYKVIVNSIPDSISSGKWRGGKGEEKFHVFVGKHNVFEVGRDFLYICFQNLFPQSLPVV